MLTPINDDAWPPELDHLRDSFTGTANVYRTMAHNPALLAAWQNLRTHVVTQSSLPPQALETVILRTAHRHGSTYEWAHHIVRGRASGLTDARILSISGEPGDMLEADAALARAVDCLFEESMLPDDATQELSQRFGHEGLLDLIATVGFYTTLAYIVKTFETPLDSDIDAALAEAPFEADH